MGVLIVIALALTGIALALAEQRSDKILIQGNAAGTQTVQTDAAGVAHVEYSYSDRGRGDHIIAIWKYPQTRNGRGKSGSLVRSRMSATAVNARKSQIAKITKEYNSWYVPVNTSRIATQP